MQQYLVRIFFHNSNFYVYFAEISPHSLSRSDLHNTVTSQTQTRRTHSTSPQSRPVFKSCCIFCTSKITITRLDDQFQKRQLKTSCYEYSCKDMVEKVGFVPFSVVFWPNMFYEDQEVIEKLLLSEAKPSGGNNNYLKKYTTNYYKQHQSWNSSSHLWHTPSHYINPHFSCQSVILIYHFMGIQAFYKKY